MGRLVKVPGTMSWLMTPKKNRAGEFRREDAVLSVNDRQGRALCPPRIRTLHLYVVSGLPCCVCLVGPHDHLIMRKASRGWKEHYRRQRGRRARPHARQGLDL